MSDISLLKQIKEYDKPHCYQYQKKLDTLEEDKAKLGFTDKDIEKIDTSDFDFAPITTKEGKEEATQFISKYEWLGTIGSYPTHWFAARYNGILGCVVIFGMPNAFSKILGENTKDIERLIARGASASWTPKNLGSCFLSWCIHWMVNNTQYRLFTAYADTQAKEQGTIYQALNFYCLGNKSGTTVRCVNPYNKNKIITDRAFRARSFYRRYCKDLGIEVQPNWFGSHGVLWENIPDDIEQELREYSREMYRKAEKIEFPKKYKYAYVLGRDKRETKMLRKKFLELNKVYDYPKDRNSTSK